MPINRRTFLGTAISGLSLLALPIRKESRLLAQIAMPSWPGNRLRLLSDNTSSTLTASATTDSFAPGTESPVFGLNGRYLGPILRFDRGDQLQLRMENQLPEQDLVIHWHGIIAPEEMDGHPMYAVGSGESYQYDFQVDQPAGTYWYHSHTDMMTAPQVYRGIAGMLIVHDEEEKSLGLPSGDYDIPLVLQDRQLTPDSQLYYQPGDLDMMRGWQGDTMMVNGTIDATLEVVQTSYRFRLLNASNARVFNVGFDDGRTFQLIANEGGLLSEPIPLSSFYLPPGARAEIVVDFSNDQIDSLPLLKTLPFEIEFFTGTRQGKEGDLLRFGVTGAGPAYAGLPTQLREIPPLVVPENLPTRTFRASHRNGGHHSINELVFEMDRVDFEVPIGQEEIWTFFNPTTLIHPFHVHATQFRLIDRNGRSSNLLPEDQGWKDMILLFPGETVRILISFTRHTGIFMLHCHNLEHEDDGMMMNFRVVPPSSVKREQNEEKGLEAFPNPVTDRTTLRFAPASYRRELALTNDLNERVMSATIPAGSDHYLLDCASLPSGSYWCDLAGEGIRLVRLR